jgi:murein endopeptidase
VRARFSRSVENLPAYFLSTFLSIVLCAASQAAEPLSFVRSSEVHPQFLPDSPTSEFVISREDALRAEGQRRRPDAATPLSWGVTQAPDPDFCSEWNPEFGFAGAHCCSKFTRVPRRRGGRRSKLNACAPDRAFKSSYCDERTPDQSRYAQRAQAGELGDLLAFLTIENAKDRPQAFCTVNNGFLAWGREVIPTEHNRIQLRNPARCTQFGTDPMVALLEWLGREVAREYSTPENSGTRLFVGDISAPRGGCLAGRGGRRGHASHTNGQDVDLGFLRKTSAGSSVDSARFETRFDAELNGWLLKRVFENPFACVRVIFLDRGLIRKLERHWGREAWWQGVRRFMRHMPGHKNHFHIRIGDGAGAPGCAAGADPELELEEDMSDSLQPGATENNSGSEDSDDTEGDTESSVQRGPSSQSPRSGRLQNESDEAGSGVESDTESGEARLQKFLEESLKLDGGKKSAKWKSTGVR